MKSIYFVRISVVPRLFVISEFLKLQKDTKVWKGIKDFVLHVMITVLEMNIMFYISVKTQVLLIKQ